ncbi:hypothetical protein PFICI_02718 [Pestalotiopsis fici W106-1]|uniref:Zn(2)-C6 fungal-type domain-containing protein n=1 Tax=Pestalotiopsis fici (strain W106-1 / CGMCC3.15140) TaxID=1229662 RepID=W3XF18_PESFW|nr:uncharacterized protein PFICI_02718 [Pestalotiopsis fici W106-1]ETS84693.1 hypothetical protein PFICI_02718 [Pestalotiopsis fici W106-1]
MQGDRRRRFAKACDSCRRKKLRCDGVRPLCARCQDANTPCHYADVDKPETRRSRARDSTRTPRRLDDNSGVGSGMGSTTPNVHWSSPAVIEAPSSVASTLPRRSNNVGPTTPAGEDGGACSLQSAHPAGTSRTQDSAGDPDTIVGRNVDTRFFGPASGISLVSIRESPREFDPSKRRTTKSRFQEGSWSSWTHPTIQGVLEKRVNRTLPSWTEAFSLVSEFFSHEHQAIPCFHPPTFMTFLGQQYSGAPSDNPAWWASLNAVLAISQRRRVENGQCDPNGEELVWEYAANALGSTLDILMRNTQLISVQALLCIAWFFLGTPNPQPSFMLTGSAVRLAHSIGLHKTDHAASMGSIEQETRNKVFWVALTLDRELCLQTGRPPTHDLQHFHVQLLADLLHDDSEIITTADGSKLSLTSSHAKLCLIQDRIYNELYSSQSSTDTSCVVESVSKLTAQLQDWCATIPGLRTDTPMYNGEHHGLIRLYYSYYNCVVLIHRPLAREYWLSSRPMMASDLSENIMSSVRECLAAARGIFHLLQAIPHQRKSFYWDVVPPILSATIILATNAMRNNISDATRSDLEAISKVIELFENLDQMKNDTYLFQVRTLCTELYQSVQHAFKSSEGQSASQLRQQDWAAQNVVTGNHHQSDIMQVEQSFQGRTMPGSNFLPMLPGIEGGNAAVGIEPESERNPSAANAWPPGILSFPDLSPWGMDILSGGLFAPFPLDQE